MVSLPKNEKYQKFAINYAFGEKVAAVNVPFKHPDGWNALANQRQIQRERREDLALLQGQQRATLLNRCRHDDRCRQLDCHFQHSPDWDPKRNQQLFEEKRRRDEQRREEQRNHAIDVLTKGMSEEKKDLSNCQVQKKFAEKHVIGEEYEYDDEYFDIQEKVWEKQSARHDW